MSHALSYGFVLAAGTLSGITGTGSSIMLLPVREGFLALPGRGGLYAAATSAKNVVRHP